MERGFYSFLFCLSVIILLPALTNPTHHPFIKLNLVKSWADKLGFELWNFGEYITRRKEVQNSFESAQIEMRDGKKLVDQIAQDISNMMELKVSAVKRIMDCAENMAVSLQLRDPMATVPPDFVFYNSKRIEPIGYTTTTFFPMDDDVPPPLPIRTLPLIPDPHFGNIPVNLNYSSVHVPTNVYERAENVIDAIRWSENLDSVFIDNYGKDPSLSWQYFGSSTGFMRHYPAMQWKSDPVDLYDCRTRGWYIEAATSSKDVIILVDNSGSMTGQRREIARHVVSNILDTLGNNDFVNIFTFNETYKEVVECFPEMLVQATLANVREFKLAMEEIETTGIANFSAALNQAFTLLEMYRDNRQGALCNQAIMLITDGVPYNYKEIFEKYNWNVQPTMPVRVFTYLIGREVADVREVKWMACANQGYYVHLSTLDEVREQVINYIPVMARPLVLAGDEHPVMWSPVYADITDPKMTDYQWELRENEEQKENARRTPDELDKRYLYKEKIMEEQDPGDLQAYKLMTTVSMPVFDRRENASRIANLLGVVGTDVPMEDILALMQPFQLGVNAYAFIVTNNGFILTHPDLRPVFQGILKPSYNSVDMLEVELMDDQRGPRDYSNEMLLFREAVLNKNNGSKWVQVKYHFDNMKRVSRIRKQYYWKQIKNSPFTVIVAIPEPYGLHRLSLRPEDDIHRSRLKGSNATNYFNKTSKWRIHPDWVYCRYLRESDRQKNNFNTTEDEFLHFLNRMKMQGWHWPLKPRPPEYIHCDRSLMQAIVFDGRVTKWFSEDNFNSKDERGNEIIQRYGITVAFVATHSGLTRWKTFTLPDDVEGEDKPQFGDLYPRATDEVWYKRAIEQHYIEPSSFVYSVDFDAGERYVKKAEERKASERTQDTMSTPPEVEELLETVEDEPQGSTTEVPENSSKDIPLVTATHAVFHTVDSKSAPAAVVGFQFHHTSLHQLFTNITSSCGESVPCTKTCKDAELACYMVDNNGFVVVSEVMGETGKFFGEVEPHVMKKLISERVYRKIQITDYQAVCADPLKTKNPGNRPITPFHLIANFFNWLVANIFWMWQHWSFNFSFANSYSMANEVIYQNYESDMESGSETKSRRPEKPDDAVALEKLIIINRTRPVPCDKEVYLYQLQQHTEKDKGPYKNPEEVCERPYVVQPIPNSNLILVVVDKMCPGEEDSSPIRPAAFPVIRNHSLPCERANTKLLYRRHLPMCIKYHPNESQIELCGDATHLPITWRISLVFPIIMVLVTQLMLRQMKYSVALFVF